MNEIEVGRFFEGKYRIVRPIASGSFGSVYLAHQEGMDREVALKILRPKMEPQASSDSKQRFLREVRVIAQLRHPNTVNIHDFGESESGLLYMVLEYVDGETLKESLDREGAFSPARTLNTADQIARSLAEAHRHGVVHRDLKPANVMLTHLEGEGEFVKVLDFGVARLLPGDSKDLTQVGTLEGKQALIGTPRYMSPEQIRGDRVDGRSDIYSLGLLVYEMLAGKPAVEGDTSMGLISEHISPKPLELDGLETVAEPLHEFVETCCAKDPEARYLTTDACVRELRSVASRIDADLSSGVGLGSSDESPAATGESTAPYRPTDRTPESTGSEFDSQSLPPPPDEDASFITGHRMTPRSEGEREQAGGQSTPDSKPEERAPVEDSSGREDPASELLWDATKLAVLGAAAGLGVYVAFLVISTMFGEILGDDLRFLVALLMAVALPLVTAIDELRVSGSQNPKQTRIDRIARTLLATAIISLGSGALVSLAFPDTVVTELRTRPNWFLSESELGSTSRRVNRAVSESVADVVGSTTRAIGVYDPPNPIDPGDRPPAAKTPPPPPPNSRSGENPGDDKPSRSALELMRDDSDSGSEEQKKSRPRPDQSNGRDEDGKYEPW